MSQGNVFDVDKDDGKIMDNDNESVYNTDVKSEMYVETKNRQGYSTTTEDEHSIIYRKPALKKTSAVNISDIGEAC